MDDQFILECISKYRDAITKHKKEFIEKLPARHKSIFKKHTKYDNNYKPYDAQFRSILDAQIKYERGESWFSQIMWRSRIRTFVDTEIAKININDDLQLLLGKIIAKKERAAAIQKKKAAAIQKKKATDTYDTRYKDISKHFDEYLKIYKKDLKDLKKNDTSQNQIYMFECEYYLITDFRHKVRDSIANDRGIINYRSVPQHMGYITDAPRDYGHNKHDSNGYADNNNCEICKNTETQYHYCKCDGDNYYLRRDEYVQCVSKYTPTMIKCTYDGCVDKDVIADILGCKSPIYKFDTTTRRTYRRDDRIFEKRFWFTPDMDKVLIIYHHDGECWDSVVTKRQVPHKQLESIINKQASIITELEKTHDETQERLQTLEENSNKVNEAIDHMFSFAPGTQNMTDAEESFNTLRDKSNL